MDANIVFYVTFVVYGSGVCVVYNKQQKRNKTLSVKKKSRNFFWTSSIKSMWNTAVGIKNCKQLFSLRVVNASSGEKSCLQFSIPTGSGAGREGGISHSLNLQYWLAKQEFPDFSIHSQDVIISQYWRFFRSLDILKFFLNEKIKIARQGLDK